MMSAFLKQRVMYETLMAFLALCSVVFAFQDLRGVLEPWQEWCDWVIWGVFVADYGVRLCLSSGKWEFIKAHWIDLIAILPFNSFCRGMRLLRFARLLKFLRVLAVMARFMGRTRSFFDTNGFKYVLLVTAIVLLAGGYSLHLTENISLEDGIWWSFVTAATVGYGDIAPQSLAGRVVAIVVMLIGIGLIGMFTSTVTTFFMHRPRSGGVKGEALEAVKRNLDRFDELSEGDVEDICRLLLGMKRNKLPVVAGEEASVGHERGTPPGDEGVRA